MLIDDEVKKIVNACMDRAEKILKDNTDTLHRLSAALLEREILDGEEIDKIIRGEELPPFEKLIEIPEDENMNGKKLEDKKDGKISGQGGNGVDSVNIKDQSGNKPVK